MVCVLLAAVAVAQPAGAEEFELLLAGGRVTLHAADVPAGDILAEWSRIGGTRFVGVDTLAGSLLTLSLQNVPEAEALRELLGAAKGYIAVPGAVNALGESRFERVLVLASSHGRPSATQAAAAVAQPRVRSLAPAALAPDTPVAARVAGTSLEREAVPPTSRKPTVRRPAGAPRYGRMTSTPNRVESFEPAEASHGVSAQSPQSGDAAQVGNFRQAPVTQATATFGTIISPPAEASSGQSTSPGGVTPASNMPNASRGLAASSPSTAATPGAIPAAPPDGLTPSERMLQQRQAGPAQFGDTVAVPRPQR